MISFIQQHGVAVLVVGWLLTNAISTLPTPRDGSSAFYEWFFRFAQAIGGAIPRLLAIYAPTTLNTLTGQTAKTTTPPNPPLTEPQIDRLADTKAAEAATKS
jgi:hypothetical protein